jgi:hypothetical protein
VTSVPHLSMPFSWAPGGHAAENEQDTQSDVAACIAALFLCPLGWRAEIVEYGTPEQVFLLDLQRGELASAITRWEPRADYLLAEDTSADLLTKRVNVLLGVPT